jgi:hypothetical protein
MGRKEDKGRLPDFVPLLLGTLDSPAWRALSHGAKALYVSLKRRVPRQRNEAYLSYRHALLELKSSKRKIAEWFRELQHYGFIVLTEHGMLGVEGKGKSPRWRLTELGKTSKANSGGEFEPPTKDFLKWNGVQFCPPSKHKNPGSYVGTTAVPTGDTVAVPTSDTPRRRTGSYGVDIERAATGSYGVDITSLTTQGEIYDGHGGPWTKPILEDLGPRRFKPRRRNGRWA